MLDLYRREIDRVMALCGWDDLAAIDATALGARRTIWRAPRRRDASAGKCGHGVDLDRQVVLGLDDPHGAGLASA